MERRIRRPTTEAGTLKEIPSFGKAIRLNGKSERAPLKDLLDIGAQGSIHAESFVDVSQEHALLVYPSSP